MFLKNLLKKIRSPKGFTFIELLIAIAIISIMVSIGAVSFSAAQRQGRDAQRKSDLETIRSGLEGHFADNNTYPLVTDDLVTSGNLNEVPTDPDSSPYNYTPQTASAGACSSSTTPCVRYEIYACLENVNDQNRDDVDGGPNDECGAINGLVSYTRTAND